MVCHSRLLTGPLFNRFHNTVEPRTPWYLGHLGTRYLVLYKEVVLSLEVQNVFRKI